jgi:sulfate/thiosulfate transport system substrate-binding protein
MRTKLLSLSVLALLVAVGSGCGGTGEESGGGGGGESLSLVAYSTPKEAYEEIIPAFQKTEAGSGASVSQSYGASGEQSRAVQGGLPADVVALSLEPDVTKLVDKGLVAEDWNKDRYKGFVTNSVVVFAVRKGNPKNIKTWDDLVKPGVEVITPNPFTSGGAKWNVMAAYGSQLQQGKSEQQATDYLKSLFENVAVQDKSAREALQTFTGGKGDVLIAYENEAILARTKGEELDYVVPAETILIENPIAVVTEGGHTEKAQAFVDFVRSPDAQRVFGKAGYRPVLKDVLAEFDYPTPAKLFTIADLGGWSSVREEFFDVETGIMADIQRELGQSLGE